MLKRMLPNPLVLQGMLAAVVFLFALTPSTGGTALYLPLAPARPAQTLAWSQAHGARPLAAGPYAGAFFLHVPSSQLTASALRDGALLVSVPEFLCGSTAPNKMAQEP